MIFRFNLTLVFISIAVALWSQSPPDQVNSIVHLKNGSVFIGEILDDQGTFLDMRLEIGNELTVPKREVKFYLPAENILVHDNGKYHLTRGIFFNFSFGMNFGNFFSFEGGEVSTHTTYLLGYNINRRWALGGGFAFEFNEAQISGFFLETQYNPLFFYGRYYLTTTRARLFAYGRIGYGLKAENQAFFDDHRGGFQFQGGGGVHFASRRKLKFVLSLGYHLQKTDGSESFIDNFGNEVITEYDLWLRRLILNAGIELNWGRRRF